VAPEPTFHIFDLLGAAIRDGVEVMILFGCDKEGHDTASARCMRGAVFLSCKSCPWSLLRRLPSVFGLTPLELLLEKFHIFDQRGKIFRRQALTGKYERSFVFTQRNRVAS
jgi:hypothetical protein